MTRSHPPLLLLSLDLGLHPSLLDVPTYTSRREPAATVRELAGGRSGSCWQWQQPLPHLLHHHHQHRSTLLLSSFIFTPPPNQPTPLTLTAWTTVVPLYTSVYKNRVGNIIRPVPYQTLIQPLFFFPTNTLPTCMVKSPVSLCTHMIWWGNNKKNYCLALRQLSVV